MPDTIEGHFDYATPGNTYTNGVDPVDASLIQNLDQKAVQSVNGDGGGSYAPINRIFIGGKGAAIGPFGLIDGSSIVADLDELAALTGMEDDDIVVVRGGGAFYYLSSGVETVGPMVVASDTTGQWIHVDHDLVGAAGGIAPLNSTARVPPENISYGTIARHVLRGSGIEGMESLAPANTVTAIGSTTVTFTDPLEDDLVVFEVTGYVVPCDSNTQYVTSYVQVSRDGASWVSQTDSSAHTSLGAGGDRVGFAQYGEYVVTAADATAGVLHVRLAGVSSSSEIPLSVLIVPTFFRSSLIRP